jgi:iron complex transport system permease protein
VTGTAASLLPSRFRVVRVFGRSVRVDLRVALVGLIVGAAVVVLAAVAITLGTSPIPVAQVIGAFTGDPDADGARRIVLEWRLPRIVLAIVAGAALGLSGALFQSITRNPLGSPDIIGFNTGAYTGALVAILVIGSNYVGVSIGALLGGLGTAAIVYLFAWRRGVQGQRLIVIGIAVTAVLQAVNVWLILSSKLELAFGAASWTAGSFNEVRWPGATPVIVLVALVLPFLMISARRLHILELGDDAARALGVRVERTRLMFVVLGVLLTAIVTAAVGPVSFVALAAPQVGRWLARSPGVALIPAAVVGAFFVLAADVLAQQLVAPGQLPVGLVTLSLGGVYLLALLVHQSRKKLT